MPGKGNQSFSQIHYEEEIAAANGMKENRNVFASPAPAFEASPSHFHPALQSVYIN